LEKERTEAESKHLEALLQFAARAYRRPLSKTEGDDLLGYYHELRSKNELSHDDALRDAIVSVLMSPDFLYRIDLSTASTSVRPVIQPLSSYELASRLSYFLWCSMPDEELLRHAASGDLRKADVLLAQTRRMLKDVRVYGMATEFTGNWLSFRQFETNNSVDRAAFSQLQQRSARGDVSGADPVSGRRSFCKNRSVLDLVYGDYTFVNPVLAQHYGMPGVTGDSNNWVRVDDAGSYGRGGLLPMAVFPDAELAGTQNESGEARKLGGAESAGNQNPATAASGA
jgi:hypothetical protein